MTAQLIVFGVVLGMYGLVAFAVLAVERYGRLQEAVPVNRRLAGRESDAVRRLLDGGLERAAYQANMAAIATQDAAQHPLDVPELRQ